MFFLIAVKGPMFCFAVKGFNVFFFNWREGLNVLFIAVKGFDVL